MSKRKLALALPSLRALELIVPIERLLLTVAAARIGDGEGRERPKVCRSRPVPGLMTNGGFQDHRQVG